MEATILFKCSKKSHAHGIFLLFFTVTKGSDNERVTLIIGSLGGLAKSYIDAKTAVKITEAEIKKKQLTGEIDWEQSAIEASKDSWKDELWTVVFVLILAANFVPSLQDTMARGFTNLETTPLWVQWGMYASIAASFGIRTVKGFKK